LRKIVIFTSVSLNGFFEGPNHDISWHNVDDEFNKFGIEQLREIDTILFGRRTYQLFEDAFPKIAADPATSKDNLEKANLINNMNKIVYSKTLQSVTEKEGWRNIRLVRQMNPDEIKQWKQEPGKNISAGGNELVASLAENGLIDEFRIVINPIALTDGTSLLHGIRNPLRLRLLKTQTFKSGNLLLTYEPAT